MLYKSMIEARLKAAGILELFGEILDGSELDSKAEKIKRIVAKEGYSLSDSIMLGDTRSDLYHGHHAGARTVAVGLGYQARDVLDLESPDWYVESPIELLNLYALE